MYINLVTPQAAPPALDRAASRSAPFAVGDHVVYKPRPAGPEIVQEVAGPRVKTFGQPRELLWAHRWARAADFAAIDGWPDPLLPGQRAAALRGPRWGLLLTIALATGLWLLITSGVMLTGLVLP